MRGDGFTRLLAVRTTKSPTAGLGRVATDTSPDSSSESRRWRFASRKLPLADESSRPIVVVRLVSSDDRYATVPVGGNHVFNSRSLLRCSHPDTSDLPGSIARLGVLPTLGTGAQANFRDRHAAPPKLRRRRSEARERGRSRSSGSSITYPPSACRRVRAPWTYSGAVPSRTHACGTPLTASRTTPHYTLAPAAQTCALARRVLLNILECDEAPKTAALEEALQTGDDNPTRLTDKA